MYGPRDSGASPVWYSDKTTLLTDRSDILERWAEHFNTVLNQRSNFDDSVLDGIPQWKTADELQDPPSLIEATNAIRQMSTGKAPGEDSIPAEIYKCGGLQLAQQLQLLYTKIWAEESVPQEFRDALVIHLYKRKGDRACCDDHRGISLLSVAGKILARLLTNRLSAHVDANDIIPESQFGFRSGRGTTDMIFTARQIQEKCKEQHKDLYAVFIDLTKAFDSVSRDGLWKILGKIGCPAKFINIIRSFHCGMMARVQEAG